LDISRIGSSGIRACHYNRYSLSTLLLLPNVIQVNVYYNWNLIQNDRDDDKFVDCAIASNADAELRGFVPIGMLE